MISLSKKNIIIISNEPWGNVWFSKHNYANELSKENTVYFINPSRKWKFRNLFTSNIQIQQIKERLYSITYTNRIPRIFKRLNNRVVSKALYNSLKKKGVVNPIFWSFDPIRLSNPSYFKPEIAIFHSVDKYTFKRRSEREMCNKADVIFTVSKEFIADLQPYGKPLLYVPHGIPSDDFEVSETPKHIAEILPERYILYIGTVDFRLDFVLIEKIVTAFSDMKFVFVGPINRPADVIFDKLFRTNVPPNLIILPAVPFKELKYFINKSLACLAPMDFSAHGNNISHHKVFQYMAFGKPVFGCVFSEYEQFRNLLYMDDDHEKLIGQLNEFLAKGEDSSLREKRIEKAAEMKFENHLKSIEQFLNDNRKD